MEKLEAPALKDDLFIKGLIDLIINHEKLARYDEKVKAKVTKDECLKYIYGVVCENQANFYLKNKSFYFEISDEDFKNNVIFQKNLEKLFEKNLPEILAKFKKSNKKSFENKIDIVFELVLIAYSHTEFRNNTHENMAIEVIIKSINNLKKLEKNKKDFVCYFELSKLKNQNKFTDNQILDAQNSMLDKVLKHETLNNSLRNKVKSLLKYHCTIHSFFEKNIGQNNKDNKNYILELFDFIVKDFEVKNYKIEKRIFILKIILNFVVSFLLKQKVISQASNPKALELHTF